MIWRNFFTFAVVLLLGTVVRAECLQDILSSIASAKVNIESKYDQFKIHSDHGFEFYQSLTLEERKVLTSIKIPTGPNALQELRQSIVSHIQGAGGLESAQKTKLIERLGLDAVRPDRAIENFRQRFEYFFWTDHSKTHMHDILNKSAENAVKWPKGFVKPYQDILSDELWKERMEWAIRMHDSYMHQSRAMHAEMLLLGDDVIFPKNFSTYEKNMVSVISTLHSKSLIPYSQLSKWPEILEKKIIPHLLDSKFITSKRAGEIKLWLRQLSPKERQGVEKAASWIRMSDVDRPIGAALKNSSGARYTLNSKNEIFVEHAGEKIPMVPSQYGHIYGQMVIDNIRIVPASPGATTEFIAEFKLGMSGKEGELFHDEVNRLPLLNWIQDGTVSKNIEKYREI